MAITGFKFSVLINGKNVGCQSVTTRGDELLLVKHVKFMDDLPDDLPGAGLITVITHPKTMQAVGFDGTFTGYGVSCNADDLNLMNVRLTGVQFHAKPVFKLDATKS